MIDDKIGILLHQKSFSGEALTEEEKQLLESWYSQKDKAESSLINSPIPPNTIDQLRDRISKTLKEVTKLTHQLQELTQENDKIRIENERLYRLLVQKTKVA